MPAQRSRVKTFQEQAEKAEPSKPIRVTLRTWVGYEYHLTMEEQAVRDLLDPECDNAFIPVPVVNGAQGIVTRYCHTGTIAEVDLHDPLTPPQVG